MPETPTARLSLHKPLSDGSELVNLQTDLLDNWDKIDLAAGFQACTSSTRPSTPYSGKGIRETDTARSYLHNGSSPASAGWVQIPNSASTFDADLDLTIGKQLNIGVSGSSAVIATVTAASGANMISSRVTGDTASRWFVNADGSTNWGPGGASSTDVALARSGSGTLTLTGNLAVTGVGQERYVTKAGDTSRSSTTTLADDPELTATVVANGVYYVEFMVSVKCASATPNVKTAWTTPTATGLKFCIGPTNSAVDFTTRTNTRGRFSAHNYSTSNDYITNSTSVGICILEKAIVTIGGSGGTIAFQWAQNVSNATAVIAEAGSHMYIRRIA